MIIGSAPCIALARDEQVDPVRELKESNLRIGISIASPHGTLVSPRSAWWLNEWLGQGAAHAVVRAIGQRAKHVTFGGAAAPSTRTSACRRAPVTRRHQLRGEDAARWLVALSAAVDVGPFTFRDVWAAGRDALAC